MANSNTDPPPHQWEIDYLVLEADTKERLAQGTIQDFPTLQHCLDRLAVRVFHATDRIDLSVPPDQDPPERYILVAEIVRRPEGWLMDDQVDLVRAGDMDALVNGELGGGD